MSLYLVKIHDNKWEISKGGYYDIFLQNLIRK